MGPDSLFPVILGHRSPSPRDIARGYPSPVSIGRSSLSPGDIGRGSLSPGDIGRGSLSPGDIGSGSLSPFDLGSGTLSPVDIDSDRSSQSLGNSVRIPPSPIEAARAQEELARINAVSASTRCSARLVVLCTPEEILRIFENARDSVQDTQTRQADDWMLTQAARYDIDWIYVCEIHITC